MSSRFERTADKKQVEKFQKILHELQAKPENKKCADCKGRDPRWASANLGIFICLRCSGIHRSLGTHISKVRSIDLDTWIPEHIDTMQRWGNARANKYWEHSLPANHVPEESNIAAFIRSKYDTKKFCKPGPIPEPETLDGGVASSAPSAAASTASAVAAPVSSSKGNNGFDSSLDIFGTQKQTQDNQALMAIAGSLPPPRPATTFNQPQQFQQPPQQQAFANFANFAAAPSVPPAQQSPFNAQFGQPQQQPQQQQRPPAANDPYAAFTQVQSQGFSSVFANQGGNGSNNNNNNWNEFGSFAAAPAVPQQQPQSGFGGNNNNNNNNNGNNFKSNLMNLYGQPQQQQQQQPSVQYQNQAFGQQPQQSMQARPFPQQQQQSMGGMMGMQQQPQNGFVNYGVQSAPAPTGFQQQPAYYQQPQQQQQQQSAFAGFGSFQSAPQRPPAATAASSFGGQQQQWNGK